MIEDDDGNRRRGAIPVAQRPPLDPKVLKERQKRLRAYERRRALFEGSLLFQKTRDSK